MRTTIMIGLLVGLFGCGDNTVPTQSEAASIVTPDAGSDDAPSADAATTDACIQAQGNCGCVWYEDYNSATGLTVTRVECPDR